MPQALGRLTALSVATLAIFASLALPRADAMTLHASPITLASILESAAPGDIIHLTPGGYDRLELSGRHFSQPITITGAGAVVKDLSIRNSSGISIQNIEIDTSCGSGNINKAVIYSSSLVKIDGVRLHGSRTCASAILLRDVRDVSVTRSDVYGTQTGINYLGGINVLVDGNTVHDVQYDGIRGGCVSRLTVSNNRLTNFRPSPGDHPDAIQNWTTGCKTTTTDLAFINNIYTRGTGPLSTVAQGIFVARDSDTDTRYARVRICGNIVIGGMYNGIMATGADEIDVSNNIVSGFQDMESWIRWGDNTGQTMSENRAENYIWPETPPGGGAAPPHNKIIRKLSASEISLILSKRSTDGWSGKC